MKQLFLLLAALCPAADFHFVILGDRTGETQPGIYEQLWKNTVEENPAFVITVGDTIQGLNDKTADAEWREVHQIFPKLTLYLTPGNHDIWSDLSEKLFRKYSGHPPHYSFDYEQAHFTILDNSRADQFTAAELAWLESDLRAHEKQPVKFVISHRPSWLLDILLKNPHNAVHQLAKKYGVQYVVSGHVHQMIHSNFEGVTYLSMPSAAWPSPSLDEIRRRLVLRPHAGRRKRHRRQFSDRGNQQPHHHPSRLDRLRPASTLVRTGPRPVPLLFAPPSKSFRVHHQLTRFC